MNVLARRAAWLACASLVGLAPAPALAAPDGDGRFFDPRHKEIIPEQYRPVGLPASVDAATLERMRAHILEAREAKLRLSANARKIDPLLRIAVDEPAPGLRAFAAEAPAAPNPLLSRSADGNVRIEVRMTAGADPGSLASRDARITAANAATNRVYLAIAPGALDATLQALAARKDVVKISPVLGGVTRVGSVQTEGDAAHRANKARQLLGLSGNGVKLCAISDGIQNAAFAVATGDLPGDGSGNPDVELCPLNDNAGDEGTAMLEIMHDIAPGADLGFCPAFGDAGAQGLADAVTWLAEEAFGGQGCDVIVDDVGYLTQPYFQDGVVAQAVNDAVRHEGVAYFSSAGNGAEDHYELPYLDTVAGDDGAFPLDVHDFGLAAGGASDIDWNGIVAGAGNFFAVFMQWNDAFGASGNDYDVYLFDRFGYPAGHPDGDFPIGGNGVDFQDGSGDPLEIAFVINEQGTVTPGTPFGTILPFYIVVDRFSGDPDKLLEMNFNGLFALNQVYNVPEGSVWGHPAARGAIAVAATGAVENIDGTPNPNHDIIEPFSSRGPSRIFFTENGHPVPPFLVERAKPDITAADGVSVTGVNFTSPFYGTSASAPHAAAIAALMLDANPHLRPHHVDAMLKLTARDRAEPGFDYTWGFGFVDAFNAALFARVTGLLGATHGKWWERR